MDAHRFDSLLQSLSESPSRRHALRLLAGSVLSGRVALGAGDVAAHDALLTCKKLKGDKKKKCLKKAKKHMMTHSLPAPAGTTCTPNCAGKTCGPDGCGSSCGTCDTGWICCKGGCMGGCIGGQVLNPNTCDCCSRPQAPCDQIGDNRFCCAGTCVGGPSGHECGGVGPDEPCEFDEQCYNDMCVDGRCGCPNDWEICGGGCVRPCPPGLIRNDPHACSCCLPNGSDCAVGFCCSGTCTAGLCTGRASCAECTFTEQCFAGAVCQGGRCVQGNSICED